MIRRYHKMLNHLFIVHLMEKSYLSQEDIIDANHLFIVHLTTKSYLN